MVKQLYAAKDLVIKDTPALKAYGRRRKSIGKADPWQLFRAYRDEAIDLGDYFPKDKKKKKKFDEAGRRIDKGNVREQKRKLREHRKENRQRLME